MVWIGDLEFTRRVLDSFNFRPLRVNLQQGLLTEQEVCQTHHSFKARRYEWAGLNLALIQSFYQQKEVRKIVSSLANTSCSIYNLHSYSRSQTFAKYLQAKYRLFPRPSRATLTIIMNSKVVILLIVVLAASFVPQSEGFTAGAGNIGRRTVNRV